MREDVLHYVWKHKKLDVLNLETTSGATVDLISVGAHNHNSGPDFFNAQLNIGGQLWAGNVEIHVKSSDWYAHNHETDKAYDNVILHVVFEHDAEIYRADNSKIPTLELKHYVEKNVIDTSILLLSNTGKWINCEANFSAVPNFTISNWLQRLYFERLERKSKFIQDLLKSSNNNWEAVLFKMLAKNFGLKVNGDAFLSVASSLDFSIIRKLQSNVQDLEALLFGQSGLLEENNQNPYCKELLNRYIFLKQKFQLDNSDVQTMQFFRLRPPNFPTIRWSQLANLYYLQGHLFSKIIETNNVSEFYKLFSAGTTEFWKTHYTFESSSKYSNKKLTKSFTDLLLINTILPIKFHYNKHSGIKQVGSILDLISQIKPEKNTITNGFNALKSVSGSAMDSQALIQLKNEYCDKNLCLHCAIGNSILSK